VAARPWRWRVGKGETEQESEAEWEPGRERKGVLREWCSRRVLESVEALEQVRDEAREPREAWKEAASRHRGPQ